MNKRVLLFALLAMTVAAAALYVVTRDAGEPVAESPAGTSPKVRWIVAGGGATPESNEVSIEDDLMLAQKVMPGSGLTLFASGPSNRAVRVEADDLNPDPLVSELAAIFNPRHGRSSRYQDARIAADYAATPGRFLDSLRDAAETAGPPLTVYVAGHGDKGETPAENAVVLWANFTVTPRDVAQAVAKSKRRTQFVVTTCFSGGFAELAFEAADATRPAVSTDVCGLFASTWELEAGGCDPDPDRGRHDGYGVHFLSALDGKTRTGEAISADLGDDGAVSLLDAHTHARLESGSIDVPTTTSERWLRAVAPTETDTAPHELEHERAVIAALGPRFGDATETALRARLTSLEAEIEATRERETQAIQKETDAYWNLAAVLLERWPVLDDPWHPTWPETVSTHRNEIAEFLATSTLVRQLARQTDTVNRIANARAELEVRRAPLMRLVRAHETQRLAGALAARGGPAWERFQKFRACEDSY